jgi:hypothetical protein
VNHRRSAIAGLAVAAFFALATAACNTATEQTPGTTTPTSAAPAADPKDALIASAQQLKTTSFKAKGTLSIGTADAAVDPTAKAATSKTVIAIPGGGPSITQEQIIIGTDSYVKLAIKNFPQAPPLPSGWMKLDVSKIKDPADYTLADTDPARLQSELFKGLSTVNRSGDKFTGTLDLTKGVKSGIVDEEEVTALKEKANAVPFEATVDGQGRLTSFKILVPNGDPWSVTYSDYGAPVAVTKPASSVPAPAALYELLNS